MEKYNLSVAVMQDDEPIMFIFDRDYKEPMQHTINVELCKLFVALDFYLIKGIDNGKDYCEYACSPDREREDMELLAIWQKI